MRLTYRQLVDGRTAGRRNGASIAGPRVVAERIEQVGGQFFTGSPFEPDTERLVRIDRLIADETFTPLDFDDAAIRLLDAITETPLALNAQDRAFSSTQHASMHFGQQGTPLINGQIVPFANMLFEIGIGHLGEIRRISEGRAREHEAHQPDQAEHTANRRAV